MTISANTSLFSNGTYGAETGVNPSVNTKDSKYGQYNILNDSKNSNSYTDNYSRYTEISDREMAQAKPVAGENTATVSKTDAVLNMLKKVSGFNELNDKLKTAPNSDIDTNNDTAAFQRSRKTNGNGIAAVAGALKAAADNITSDFPPAFEQLTATSDNASVKVTRVAGTSASASANENETTVNVSETAQAQVNMGNSFKNSGKDFEQGDNRFKIENNNGSFNFNINVNERDTNARVLSKVSDSVNKRDIGLEARVVSGKNSGTSSLMLKSRNTGKENAFSVQNIQRDADKGSEKAFLGSNSFNGMFAQKLGANNTVTEAKDARYSVNGGEEKTSPTNDIYIGNGISAELKAPSEEPANISLSRDTEKTRAKIQEFADYLDEIAKSAENGKTPAKNTDGFVTGMGLFLDEAV